MSKFAMSRFYCALLGACPKKKKVEKRNKSKIGSPSLLVLRHYRGACWLLPNKMGEGEKGEGVRVLIPISLFSFLSSLCGTDRTLVLLYVLQRERTL